MKHIMFMIGFMALCFVLIFGLGVYYPGILKNPVVFIAIMSVCMIGHFFMPHHKHKDNK